ncbi:undecaprenyl-phosphate glucose phosphotransferase [Pedobacter sp. MC2016-24]|uniref:undecaprenyl-phosphate glucose phosphotransferase n=1 Tax=Pedobacter sp. MC2016-24 TaxID=2780090 RepID=UPI001D1647CC|nr:undecaprenyl-phosphate glucose phosphotransferase [Pedobacter sp. MC2016-24]
MISLSYIRTVTKEILSPRNKYDAEYYNQSTSMTEKYGTYYKIIGALIDLFIVNFSGYIAYLLVHWPVTTLDRTNVNMIHILLINLIWFNVTQLTRLYQDMFAKDAIPTIKQSLSSLLLFTVSIILILFLTTGFGVSSKLIAYMMLIFAPSFLMAKIIFLLLRRSRRASLINYTDIVIVGAGPVGVELHNIFENRPFLGYRVVGFFDDKPHLRGDGIPVLGNVSDCIAYVKKFNIKEVYCALPDRAINKINRLMREADQEMVRFKLVPDVKDYFKKNVNVKMLAHFPIISPRAEPLESKSNQLFKRVFDVAFSLFVIGFVMSWLVPLIALLIKLESKGPIFFKQLRSGKDNEPFYCLKFRSMRVNQDSDKTQATKNDSRITRLGAFMRKTSIDELPQFFNVLMGDMSVVGPRPHMLQHTHEYSAIIDQFMVRHLVLPGITGWAQVSGHRGETKEEGTMEARVEADIWYLENWSMFLDLKIAFLTVWQVFAGHKNAY